MTSSARGEPDLEVEDLFVAAPAAQGAVFQAQLDGAQTYVCRLRVTLRGTIDERAFAQAVSALFRRHQALRSAFDWETAGHITQVVYRDVGTPLTIEDWRDRAAGADGAESAALAGLEQDELAVAFDAADPPLIRFRLIRLHDARYELLVSFFHGLLDGWSVHLLIEDLWALYRAIAGAQAMPAPPAPYRPYAEWLVARDRGADIAYWKTALAGPGERHPEGTLHVGRASKGSASAQRRTVRRRIAAPIATRLAETARGERATLASWFSLAWAFLLARYADRSDVVFGVTMAHRPPDVPRVAELIGALFNTVPLCAAVADARTVRESLAELRDRLLQHHAHACLEPAAIQRAIGLRGDAAQMQTCVRVQTLPPVDLSAVPSGLELESSTLVDLWHYAVCLVVEPRPDGIEVRLDFDPGRFSDAEMERALGQLEHVLDQMSGSLDARLGDLDLLTPAERSRVIDEWNRASIPPGPDSILEILEEGASRHADRVVAELAGQRYTAGEIDRRAERLGRLMSQRGVGPERFVLVEPSAKIIDLFTLLLGVWKAGGAVWVRDGRSPTARIRPLLDELSVALYVGDPQQAAALGITSTTTLDALLAAAAAQDDTPRRHHPHPHSAAMVILTSGSSGVPNAVVHTQHTQAAFARFAASAGHEPGPGERFLPAEPFTGIALAIRSGATALSLPPTPVWDPRVFTQFVIDEGVRYFNLSPTHLSMVDPADLPKMRVFSVGGEAFSSTLAQKWSGQNISQQYMMTEAGGGTRGPCGPEYSDEPNVGKALSGRRVYVVDSALRPLPIGVEGEICFGGPGLARGYAGRAELTAERFVPDPFATEPGARMYRTGDLGALYADGRLAVRGRNDRQVNVRGFRVELEEVEARLSGLPHVHNVAVLQQRHPKIGAVLVAYVEPVAEHALDLALLKTQVGERLPDYMRPAFYVVVPRLPTGGLGAVKVLRSALPTPDWAMLDREHHEPPRQGTERAIADIFGELLGAPTVGRHDRFFDLGGDSLLAAQVVSRVLSGIGVELPLRAIFEAPTVAELAERVGTARRSSAPPLEIAPRAERPPLSFAQERLWFVQELEAEAGAAYHMPAAVRLTGALDVEVLRRALEEVMHRHENLRTTFAVHDGRPYQVIHPPTTFSLPIEALDGREATAAVAQETSRPFDHVKGPLFRAKLLRLGDRAHVLVVTMHHIISDGWSTGVLVRELGALYPAFLLGKPSPLPALPLQYLDYAVWQRAWLRGELLEQEQSYWKRQLAGAPEVLDLPTDRPRPATQRYVGRRVTIAISPAQTQALRQVGQARGATLFMTLLAGWKLLLSQYTGHPDVVVGTPVAGRTRAELEGLIGYFANMVVLRTDLGGEPSLAEVLERVKQTTLDAFAHQDLPFERVVEAVNPRRSPGHTPLFQVMFVMLESLVGGLSLPGLEIEQLEQERRTARFDLVANLIEQDGGVTALLEYNTDLFDHETIEALGGFYVSVLDQMIAELT